MTCMHWLRKWLTGNHRDIPDEAIAATDEATTRIRSLRQQLEPYRLESDPFAAIIRKKIMTDMYESVQLSLIHRGPRLDT